MFKVAINSESDQKEQPSLKERALKAFSPGLAGLGVSTLLSAATNLENHYTNQTAPVGEMLADYAIKDLKNKGLNYQYYQSPKRSDLVVTKGFENLSAILSSPFSPGPATYKMTLNRDENGKLPKLTKEEAGVFSRLRSKSLTSELKGVTYPDKLQKGLAAKEPWTKQIAKIIDAYDVGEDGFLKGEGAQAAESLLNLDTNAVKDIDGIIIAPRNNQRAIAHEFGHAYDTISTVHPPKSKFLRKVKSIGKDIWKLLDEPIISNLPDKAQIKLQEILSKIPRQDVRSLVRTGLGLNNTLPGTVVSATKLLNVIKPEWSKNLEDKDPTGVVKFIDENPALATTIANIPHAIGELSTTIPGTKLVYNFWKDFNKGKLNSHIFAKDVAKAVGKKIPAWEAAKFLGKNLVNTAAPIYAPLLAMYAYNKYNDYKDSK